MEYNEKNKNTIKVTIILLFLLIILLSIFLVYYVSSNNLNNDNNTNNNVIEDENVESGQDNSVSYYNFSLEYFDIEIISKISNIDNIYAIDVQSEDFNNYDLIAKYESGEDIKIATISDKQKDIGFDYRILDIDNGKVYFIINSSKKIDAENSISKLYYIDLNNLTNGVSNIENFDEVYKKDNNWCIYTVNNEMKCDIYSSQIYIKNNVIYYTSFLDKNLKSYDINTKSQNVILNNISWDDYSIDKINNKIIFLQDNQLYFSDIEGSSIVKLDNNLYGTSDFWANKYYNNLQVFEQEIPISSDSNSIKYKTNLYSINYEKKSFVLLKENIEGCYTIKNNEIDLKCNNNSIDIFYVVK